MRGLDAEYDGLSEKYSLTRLTKEISKPGSETSPPPVVDDFVGNYLVDD